MYLLFFWVWFYEGWEKKLEYLIAKSIKDKKMKNQTYYIST